VRWKKITIVGVGLLGGSLGMVVRQRRLAAPGGIAGYVRRTASLKDCERTRAVDFATTDLIAAARDSDLIILCTPLAQMKPLVKQMLPALKRGAIITDVGSVKGSVVRDLESQVAKAGGHFVGSHPMAGAEKTGVAFARADLFKDAVCVVTPSRKTNRTALRKVESFWKSVGARVLKLSPETHDQFVSRSSHLPHVVAAMLATRVLDPKQTEQAALCANGFRDTTRIASGSPEMWRDIVMANRKQVRQALDEFVRDLQQVQAILRRGKEKEVSRFLETAKERRDKWCSRCASPSPE